MIQAFMEFWSLHFEFQSTADGTAADDDTGRDTWDKPIEFLLSCISMSVGLGNVWRFPFTAYQNGGGAFLIPYIIVLFFIGKPLYFLEMSMGKGQALLPSIWTLLS